MKTIILAIWIATIIFGFLLRALNLHHLKEHARRVPPGFDGLVTEKELTDAARYTVATNRLALAETLFGQILLYALLFGGGLPLYDRLVSSVSTGLVSGGTLFFVGLLIGQTLLFFPFSLYRTFRLEARFDFNTTTFKIWFSDLCKSTIIGVILVALLSVGALALVQLSPKLWWLWTWIFFALATIFIMLISPYIIEPLFFKYEPITNPSLEEDLRTLMHRAGLKISRVFQVDASRRSRHSNAYFTGLGRQKRIVLYDTLLDQMSQNEILAILAHEAGHWKKAHILKRLIQTEAISFVFFYFAHLLLSRNLVPDLLGLADLSFAAQTVIIYFLVNLLIFPLTPLFNVLSRRDEHQADLYASHLTGDPASLASALKKLARENLSNLHPHPLYAFFHYSHPPVSDRLEFLRVLEKEKTD